MLCTMSIVASVRNSKHLADTAERTHVDLGGHDVLLGPASNGANFSETDLSESLYFERRWRWPLSYRSIEVFAIVVDTLIIVAAGVLADAAYGLTITALPTEITIYGGAAALVAALLTCVLKERGLYKPTALLNWTAQVRAVIITWIGVFMFLAGCVFALKIGSTFSRIEIISFAAVGLCGLIAQRVFWRTILEDGLANGKLSGRTIVLISDSQPGSSLQQVLLRHGFRVRRHFVVSADRSHPLHWDDVISEAISYARHSNVDELFVAADLKNWAELREMAKRLRLLPLPVNLVVVGPMSELLERPVSAIGNVTVIELQRAPLNSFELLIKRIIDIFLAGTRSE